MDGLACAGGIGGMSPGPGPRLGPFDSPGAAPAPLGWTHERARPQHRQLLPEVPGHRHRPRRRSRRTRTASSPAACIERIGSESLVTFRVEGKPAGAAHRGAARPPRGARLRRCAGWSRPRPACPASPRSATSTRSATASSTAARSSRARSLINDEVVDQIEDCIDLAPLHNPANLKGIYAARELLGPGVPQVAVFDTSFHSTMPEVSYLYAIPYPLYVRHKIRRYGFHGTSHRYVAYRYRIAHRQVATRTRTSSPCTSATAARRARSRRASRSTPRWASPRSRAW